MHRKRVGFDELEGTRGEFDHPVVGQDDSRVGTRRQNVGERPKRPFVQAPNRFAPRRSGPTVRGVCGDPVDAGLPQGQAARVRDGESPACAADPEGRPGPMDHSRVSVESDRSKADRRRLEENSAGAAKWIEDGPSHRHPREIHNGPRELRMQ